MELIMVELDKLFQDILNFLGDSTIENGIDMIDNLAELVIKQLQDEEYQASKYRNDRNETIHYFDTILNFKKTGLSLSMDHLLQYTNLSKKRIYPYPNYSGIVISIPKRLSELSVYNV